MEPQTRDERVRLNAVQQSRQLILDIGLTLTDNQKIATAMDKVRKSCTARQTVRKTEDSGSDSNDGEDVGEGVGVGSRHVGEIDTDTPIDSSQGDRNA